MSELNDFNQKIIAEFRANQGKVGGQMEGMPVLLLTTTGNKTGRTLTKPLAYSKDGDRIFVIASFAGSPHNPGWFCNLEANPIATVEVGTERFQARARITASEERERLFRFEQPKALHPLGAALRPVVDRVLFPAHAEAVSAFRVDVQLGREALLFVFEVKHARLYRNNGDHEPFEFQHLFSPYADDRSALTDCEKLAQSQFTGDKAVLIYGFAYPDRPVAPLIDAFEVLARSRVHLGPRHGAPFSGLIHPYHRAGWVFAWQI